MRIGDNVRLAIDAMECEPKEIELAVMLGCAAIDGAARRTYPSIRGSRDRFVRLIRDNYWLLETLAVRGIDLDETRWTNLSSPKFRTGPPDFADALYEFHRCNHMHGDEVPFGHTFLETTSNADGTYNWNVHVARNVLALPDRLPFALAACAVLSPTSVGESVPDGYYFFTLNGNDFLINDWWGRAAEFREVADKLNHVRVKLELGTDW